MVSAPSHLVRGLYRDLAGFSCCPPGKWFFGVDTITDWKVGSPLVHKGTWQGKPYEDKGSIIQFKPPELLEHSHWSSLSGLPDHAENYQHVTWALVEQGRGTDLTVSEVNLPSQEAQAVSEKSWHTVLGNLKALVEKRPSG